MTGRSSDTLYSPIGNISTPRIVQLLTSIAIMNASLHTALVKATMPETHNDVCDELETGMPDAMLSSHVQ